MVVAHDAELNLPVTYIPDGSKHKKAIYMHNGYSYLRSREKNGIKYLRCRMMGRCRVVAKLTRTGVFSYTHEHTCHD